MSKPVYENNIVKQLKYMDHDRAAACRLHSHIFHRAAGALLILSAQLLARTRRFTSRAWMNRAAAVAAMKLYFSK